MTISKREFSGGRTSQRDQGLQRPMHQPGDDLVRVREDHHQGLQGSSAARRGELAEPGHQPQRVRVRSSVSRAGSQAGQELVQQHSAKDAQGAGQAGQGS